MNLLKVIKYEARYTSYLVEADNEEVARSLVVNDDVSSHYEDSYIDDWYIESITPYVERES